MATVAAIKVSAAEFLGILGEGETLPSYESDDMGQSYIEVHAEYQALGLFPWSNTAVIPDQYAKSVAILVAEGRVAKYPTDMERYQRIKLEGIEADVRIRELQARGKMGQTEIENF